MSARSDVRARSPSGRSRRTPTSCAPTRAPRSAVIVDPGRRGRAAARGDRRRSACEIEAILITHCHFDHIGAVAPVARATGAPGVLPGDRAAACSRTSCSWVPPGFGPFESYEAEHTVAGGERLSLAGLDIEVIFTPGHSPGHVTYAIARRALLLRATCCSRARSAASTCPAGTGRRSSARSAACSTAFPARDGRLPRAHGRHDARARARHQPVPRRAARRASPRGAGSARRTPAPAAAKLSAPKIKAPRGTFDVLGEQAAARATLEARARAILEGAGYERIETPAFEATELFARGVGESTDIVQQGDVHASRTAAGAR